MPSYTMWFMARDACCPGRRQVRLPGEVCGARLPPRVSKTGSCRIATLGTVLRGMQDYRRATIAFAYAAALSPGSATIASNRGWLAMSQGDATAAAPLFAKAAQIGPAQPVVLLGQALIEECAGHHAKALPLFRASLALQWSDMAAAGVQWAGQSLQKASGSAADLGSPDAYGGKTGQTPDWPNPPRSPPGSASSTARRTRTAAGPRPATARSPPRPASRSAPMPPPAPPAAGRCTCRPEGLVPAMKETR